MMAIYDLLAPYYDAATGDSATEAAFIHDIIERRHSQASTLLDLACGLQRHLAPYIVYR